MAALVLLVCRAGAAEPVVEIRFEGNRTTREPVLRQELLFAEGDPADPGVIEASRQSLMNTGLFKDVGADTVARDDGVVVTYRLTEKYFYFVLPRLNRSADGDIRYGAEVRADNLLGLNQQLRLLYEIDEPEGGTERDGVQYSLNYRMPRIPGTRFGAAFDLGEETRERSPSAGDDVDRYEESIRYVGVSVFRWLDRRGPSRGWRMDMGTRWETRRYDGVDSGAVLPDAGEDVSWHLGVIYTDVADLGVRREGLEYGGRLTVGIPGLGVNRNHQRLDLFYRRYTGLGGAQPANLNYQLRFGWTGDTPFGGFAYDLGSSSTVRGYPTDYREGDVRLLANAEYLRPLFGNPAVRGVVFMDAGGVWPRDDLDPGDFLFSGGLGLRINLRWFVRTDLRLDAAWGSEGKVYAGTSHAF